MHGWRKSSEVRSKIRFGFNYRELNHSHYSDRLVRSDDKSQSEIKD